MKFLITGKQNSEKTTALLKIVENLGKNYKVVEIITLEVRIKGERIGFEVVDIFSGERKLFSSIYFKTKYKVGKYFVDVGLFDEICVKALTFVLKECKVIAIDEIGKMEMLSENFLKLLNEILESEKIFTATLHLSYLKDFEEKGKVYRVERRKSEEIAKTILEEVKKLLS